WLPTSRAFSHWRLAKGCRRSSAPEILFAPEVSCPTGQATRICSGARRTTWTRFCAERSPATYRSSPLLEAVEPRDHLAHVAPAAAGVCHFVLQEPQLSVHAQNFRSHRPVIETRQKSHHRVEHAQDRNEQNKELAEQRCHPEWKIIVKERQARFVEAHRFAA